MIRISLPETAYENEIIQIKAMMQHPMETGYRRNSQGEEIPRDIITEFQCSYQGKVIFSGTFSPGIAANPFLVFHARARQTGTITFTWTDQNGQSWSEQRTLTVS